MTRPSFSSSCVDWLENIESYEHLWPGLNLQTPQLMVSDVQKAIIFYKKIFGFIPIFILPDDSSNINFARMRYRGTNFTLSNDDETNNIGKTPVCTATTPPFCFYLYVDSVAKAYADALAQGCKSLDAPHDECSGDNKARIVDIFGYIWDIAAKI